MVIETLRKSHLQLIEEVPTEVMILRTTKDEDGAGGFIETGETEIGPIKVRITPITRAIRNTYSEAGETTKEQWQIFAPYDADIRQKDRLEYEDKELEIIRVTKRWYRGEVYAIQCEAEEVS